LCYVRLIVDIDFVEGDTSELFGELLEDRGDEPAGAAPGCPKVEYGVLVLVDLGKM